MNADQGSSSETIRRHYESLLAEHYSWMLGDFATKIEEQLAQFQFLGVIRGDGNRALDLGCGSGLQSIALARLGFSVDAIDISPTLLAEVQRRKGNLAIRIIEGDFTRLADLASGPYQLAACMGDTLSHLESEAAGAHLFRDTAALLDPGAPFLIAYRELSQPLAGPDRVIPVRSDPDKIFTCFLDFHDRTVTVTDVVHLRAGSEWTMSKSSYTKLRLPASRTAELLAAAGFTVEHIDIGRMTTIRARR